MKPIWRTRPFLSVALVTLLLGGAYHVIGIDRSTTPGAIAYGVTYTLGFVFISATRLVRAVIDNRAVAGILSLAIGLTPYLLADWLLRRRRFTARSP